MRDLEALLLTVSSGAGMALVPHSVAERYGAPGLGSFRSPAASQLSRRRS